MSDDTFGLVKEYEGLAIVDKAPIAQLIRALPDDVADDFAEALGSVGVAFCEAQRAHDMRAFAALTDAYLGLAAEDILARVKEIMRELGIEVDNE